jgi:hypothetical protein
MEIFFDKCLDHKLITRYICSDDKSCDADRDRMQREYPQMEFMYTNEGHAASLRQLFAAVDTDYMFHWEDDWEICDPACHIQNLLEILWSEEQIKTVLMTPWTHGREKASVIIMGSETASGNQYFVLPKGGELVEYWPGFSLNPGMHDVAAIHSLGEYPIVHLHEWSFADIYRKAGFRVAFAPRYWVHHFCMDTAYSSEADR